MSFAMIHGIVVFSSFKAVEYIVSYLCLLVCFSLFKVDQPDLFCYPKDCMVISSFSIFFSYIVIRCSRVSCHVLRNMLMLQK